LSVSANFARDSEYVIVRIAASFSVIQICTYRKLYLDRDLGVNRGDANDIVMIYSRA
jgi:hypothetical protein